MLDVNCIDQTWRRNWKIHENDTVPLPCLQVYLWPRLTFTLTSWPRSEISCPCHVGHLCANLHQNQLFTFKIFIHKFVTNERTDRLRTFARLSICPLLLCLYSTWGPRRNQFRPQGMLPQRLVWKTRMVWLLDIEKSLTDVFSRFDTIMACDGGRTDGQKYCDSIVRAI